MKRNPDPHCSCDTAQRNSDAAYEQRLIAQRTSQLFLRRSHGREEPELNSPLAQRDGERIVDQGNRPCHDNTDHDRDQTDQYTCEIVIVSHPQPPQETGIKSRTVTFYRIHIVINISRARCPQIYVMVI